jgi:long-chain acyl-CoA synthetase
LVYGKGQSDGDTVICAKIVPDLDKIKEDKENNLIADESIEKLIEKEVRDVNKALTNYKHIKETALQEEEFIKTTTKKIKRHEELKQN